MLGTATGPRVSWLPACQWQPHHPCHSANTPTLLRRLHAVGAVEYLDIHSCEYKHEMNISMRCPPEREAP